MLFGNVDADEHGYFVVGIGTVHLAGFHHKHMFLEKMEAASLDHDIRGSVQRIQDLQFFMPVQRKIAAGSGLVGDGDAGGLEFGDDFVLGSISMGILTYRFRELSGLFCISVSKKI